MKVTTILPPLELYPDKTELEKEQPGLELSKACDFCDREVWVSKKKRALMKAFGKDGIEFYCYFCIEERARKDFKEKPEMIKI
jgi:hypothetical protein